jgi:hypothetical protein
MKHYLISLETLIGYFVVLLIYIVAIFPVIRTQIALVTGADELTSFMLGLIAPVFLIAIIIGIISYGLGRSPSGVWSGGE